jgi:hypothetical protein
MWVLWVYMTVGSATIGAWVPFDRSPFEAEATCQRVAEVMTQASPTYLFRCEREGIDPNKREG